MKTCLNLPTPVHRFLTAEKKRTGASMTSTINRIVMESCAFREWETKKSAEFRECKPKEEKC